MKTENDMRQQLRDAYNYNDHARRMASCNHSYMGSLATYKLIKLLGGDPPFGLFEAIDRASARQLKAGVDYCRVHGYLHEPELAVADEIFANKVWVALKGDHTDLRKQAIILQAHREAIDDCRNAKHALEGSYVGGNNEAAAQSDAARPDSEGLAD